MSTSARLLKPWRFSVDCRARFFELTSQSSAVRSDVLQQDHLTVGALQDEVQLAMPVWVTERD